MKQARHRLFCLLLVGLLLCSVSQLTVFAQNETDITEAEAAVQIENTDSADPPGDDTEEAPEGVTEPDVLLEPDSEEKLIEVTTFNAATTMLPPDVVNDFGELKTWLANNPQGGTLTLGADIEITEPVRLYLCRVEAERAIVLPAWVTLDTCIVSPSVTGGTVISRKVAAVKPSFPYLFFTGEAATGFFDNQNMRCTITLVASGIGDEYEQVYILFDDTGVDYDKPGEYPLPGVLLPPYDDLYAFDIVAQDRPLAAALTVYDPAIPYFYAFGNYFGSFSISFYYSGEYEALTLWRSDDGGNSWRIYWTYDAPESEKFIVEYDYDSFNLIFTDPAELAEPALFVFEVGEGVGSEILYVDAKTVKSVGYGGDRDSGDRIPLPWEFFTGNPADNDNKTTEPELTPAPENNTGNHTNSERNAKEKQPAQGSLPATQPIENAAPFEPCTPEEIAPLELSSENQPPPDAPRDIVASISAAVSPKPVPDAPSEPDPAAVPEEYEDETTIAISGKRLEALIRINPQMVPFAKQDIQVWIPAGLLTGLHLADTDIFAIEVEKPTQASVSVLFYMNGKALDEPFAEPFLVGLPWLETNEEIVCTDGGGKPIPFEYDKQNGLLVMTIYECGTYTIEANPNVTGVASNVDSAGTPINGSLAEVVPEPIPEQTPASFPFFPMLAMSLTGAGGAGGLAYVFRKRRVKRVI